jgi:hypothetical protein
MNANNLPIPKELTMLIAEGFWPKDAKSACEQNLHSLVPESLVRKFAPDESKLYFNTPPFSTVRLWMEKSKNQFWSDHGAITEIDTRPHFDNWGFRVRIRCSNCIGLSE